jgi:hypothetical protein
MNKIGDLSKEPKNAVPFMMRFLEEIPVVSNLGDPPTYAGTTNPSASPPREDFGRD